MVWEGWVQVSGGVAVWNTLQRGRAGSGLSACRGCGGRGALLCPVLAGAGCSPWQAACVIAGPQCTSRWMTWTSTPRCSRRRATRPRSWRARGTTTSSGWRPWMQTAPHSSARSAATRSSPPTCPSPSTRTVRDRHTKCRRHPAQQHLCLTSGTGNSNAAGSLTCTRFQICMNYRGATWMDFAALTLKNWTDFWQLSFFCVRLYKKHGKVKLWERTPV